MNAAGSTTGGYIYFYLSDLAKRMPIDRIESAAVVLEQIVAFKPKIAEARATGWNKYPSAYLRDLVTSTADTQLVLDAIAILADRPG